jgi:hypothetical protein
MEFFQVISPQDRGSPFTQTLFVAEEVVAAE